MALSPAALVEKALQLVGIELQVFAFLLDLAGKQCLLLEDFSNCFRHSCLPGPMAAGSCVGKISANARDVYGGGFRRRQASIVRRKRMFVSILTVAEVCCEES